MAQHLSVRAPWHDSGWNGCICRNPERNQACRVLKNIAQDRADPQKQQCASYAGAITGQTFLPPCLMGSGMFMSPHEVCCSRSHPYTFDIHYQHICDTDITIKPYSFIATPYRWTLKDEAEDSPNYEFFTQYNSKIELNSGSGHWVSNGKNQKNIFDYFYQNVEPGKSLIVAYAKAVPFIESPGRIVLGIGLVDSVDEICEYKYSKPPTGEMMTAFLWERNIGHSIHTDRKNGFLFPFAEIQAYLKENPAQDPDKLVVIAPHEYQDEFSYATEHLSHDALIQTLNRTIQVLQKYKEIALPCGSGASWDTCIEWCEARLRDVWLDRGAYPGLGAVLSALGVRYGFDVAIALKAIYKDNELWDNIANAIKNLSKTLPAKQKGIASLLSKTELSDIVYEIDERKAYLELLSRITLTVPQARLLLDDTTRSSPALKYAEPLTDLHTNDLSGAIIENPYILYEKSYMLEPSLQIGINQIDIAMFPPDYAARQFFLSDDTNRISEPDDKRRLRAVILSALESNAASGSTLMLVSEVISAVSEFRSDVPDIEPSIRLRTIKRLSEYFSPLFTKVDVKLLSASGEQREELALQLIRLQKIDGIINKFVDAKIDKKYDIEDNWGLLLQQALDKEARQDEEREDASRAEKVVAVSKMARSGISVLTGGAGTGKTTTLVALCLNKEIQRGQILVLAPTGKARVVLSGKLRAKNILHTAKTVFQYLQETNHCNASTWSYYISGKNDQTVPDTVIIDECSMLTEEMFGALAEALSRAKRIVFVGDPNQLPPIGTGKPFYELVQKVKLQNNQPHYANLLVSNRQKPDDTSAIRLDVELGKLFTDDLTSQVGDDLFERLAHDKDNVEFIPCAAVEQLPQTVLDTLALAANIVDIDSFDVSLGGVPNAPWMNFDDARAVENWQILSPHRNKETVGTLAINSTIQAEYRLSKKESKHKKRNTPKPLGNEGIRFGEKVINIVNDPRTYGMYSPKNLPMNECLKYIANGEVGIVTGLKKIRNVDTHVIQFSTQDGYAYNFKSGVSESESPLELAYALTVHKAQGSGFKVTILVLIEPERGVSPLVTREMLYTALTRQSEKVFIIYNKQPAEIKKYGSAELSDLAHRKTNLFGETVLSESKSGWYDSKLIHKTIDGKYVVRSKSEVIVYNMLVNAGYEPFYEKVLAFADGSKALPDFTIETSSGTMYWEHLGMLGDYNYRKNWELKQKRYAENGITVENGKLILSQDELSGAIDTQTISNLIADRIPDAN